MAVDSADSRRYFYLNTNVSVTDDVRRKWSIWQRSRVMLWGSISPLLWKGLEIASRATMGLYLIFALKQQYKNNRLLTGGCGGGGAGTSHFHHMWPGRLVRRVASPLQICCQLHTLCCHCGGCSAAPLVQTLDPGAGTKRRWAAGAKRSPADVKPRKKKPPQKNNLPPCRSANASPNNPNPLGFRGKGHSGHFYNLLSTVMSIRLPPRACNQFTVKIQSGRNQFRVPHKYNLE